MTRLPGLARLLWMLSMQPLQLHGFLESCGVGSPDGSVLSLLRGKELRAPVISYIARMLMLLFVLSLLGALLASASLRQIEFTFKNLLPVTLIGALGAGMLGFSVALVSGITLGVGVAAALSITLTGAIAFIVAVGAGSAPEPAYGAVIGMAAGLITGLALDASRGLAVAEQRSLFSIIASSLLGGVIYGAVLAVLVAAFDPSEATESGIAAGTAFGMFLFFASSRLIFYPLEAVWQMSIYCVQLWAKWKTLGLSPVLFHDLGRLPYPGLFRHILLGLEADPVLADRVRDACRRAPGQRSIAVQLLPYLQSRQLESLIEARDFAGLLRLRGDFLPGVEGASPWQLTLRESARYLQAAQATSTPYLRLQHLRNAEETVATLEAQILVSGYRVADILQRVISRLRVATDQGRQEAEAEAVHQVPNPFRAGDPLSPEQGGELFRGREEIVRQLEQLLADPSHSFSLALLGPRRCGKTSLLRMLPVLLPDAFCLFFDLQDNPIDTPEAFFRALAERGHEQANRDRRVQIPPLPKGPPFEAGREWLGQLDEIGRTHRILLCFDEFESLEATFPGEHRDLLRLMGILRGTIQHRRHIRLLVSGTSPFDELGPLWNDYFINLRELHVGHLEKDRALELLMRPVSDFPPAAVPFDVAEAVFERTGGQPFLLQLYGFILVSRLNEVRRHQASMGDLVQIDDEILTMGRPYFANTVQSAPDEVRRALVALANERNVKFDTSVRLWLRRRSLIGEEGRLCIPILGRWIREEIDELPRE